MIWFAACLSVAAAPALAQAAGPSAASSPAAATAPAQEAGEERASEELVIFVTPADASPVAEAFRTETIPEVEALAEELGLGLRVVDVTDRGAPDEIGFTPAIVYQSARGRSMYVGRANTIDRLENHVRTSRFTLGGPGSGAVATSIPDNQTSLVMPLGRAEVIAPLKVTDVAGVGLDAEADPAAFSAETEDAIAAGMRPHFDGSSPTRPAEAQRLFYADFYPHRGESGVLTVGVAVFSQFHCHESVFSEPGAAQGDWADRQAVFEQAGKVAAEAILAQLDRPEFGDGIDARPAYAATASYEELGLPLPEPDADAPQVDPADLTLGRAWAVDAEAAVDSPMIAFTFPPPIRGYSGRAVETYGSLTLGEDLSLADATGEFVVPVESLTMGDRDLDAYLRNGILDGEEHPESRFVLESIETSASSLAFGSVVPGVLVGTFSMDGRSEPLRVPASIEAFVGSDGQPRVSLSGRWELDLATFGVADRPPGPAHVAGTLVFNCRIVLEPAKPSENDPANAD